MSRKLRINPIPGPRLAALLVSDTVRSEGCHYIVQRRDGRWVSIGHVEYCDAIEAYLEINASNEQW